MEIEHVEAHFVCAEMGQRGQPFSSVVILARRPDFPDPEDKDISTMVPTYYCVRHQRFEARRAYSLIEEEICKCWELVERKGTRNYLLINQSGGGEPTVQSFRSERHIRTIGIVVHTGEVTSDTKPDEHHVAFETLVSQVIRAADIGAVRFAEKAVDEELFKAQAASFGQRPNRRTKTLDYEKLEEDVQTDLLMAIGLGVWYGQSNHGKYWGPSTPGTVERDYNPLRDGGGKTWG